MDPAVSDPVAGLDVVYLVRPGEANDELHYSLRSLENLIGHGRVWFVGLLPRWARNVGHISGNRGSTKALNVFDNVRLACADDRLTPDVVVMNDDFYVMRAMAAVPSWYRGSLDAHIARIKRRSDWLLSLHHTRTWLREHGCPAPLSYELHKPIVVNRARMLAVLDACVGFHPTVPPQWRTVYGNFWAVEAEPAPDPRIGTKRPCPTDALFLSSCDGDWRTGPVGRRVRDAFADQCVYEKPVRPASGDPRRVGGCVVG